MKKSLIILFTCMAGMVYAQPKAKNVIFMIGDGMGINQIYAALTANGGSLNIEQCPVTGFSKSYSASNYITDSAAGGTALATGTKTRNNMVGLAPDSTTVLRSSLYYAERNGKATGIVVTCPLTHATPASFYAHQVSRHMYEEIALDLLDANIDVMIGGGRQHLEKRKDGQNLSKKFADKGYEVVYTEQALQNSTADKILAPLADIDMPVASKRGNYLPDAVEKAIATLARDTNGFFLMVEGSQIDYQCHNNNAEEMVCEMRDFDNAIGKALEFARQDGNTLVVITADHETGALSILNGDFEAGTVECQFNTTGHSGVPVPVFVFGPGAEQFTGIQQNTDFRDKVLRLMGIEAK
ncbi:MAG: alkaline phosphatase [Paludibacteraceae bacterium]